MLFIGTQKGVLLGIGGPIVAALYQMSQTNAVELGPVHGPRQFREGGRFSHAVRLESSVLLRVDVASSFATADYFTSFLLEDGRQQSGLSREPSLTGRALMPSTHRPLRALIWIAERLNDSDIELHMTGLIGPVRETVRRSPPHSLLDEERFPLTPHEAVSRNNRL